MNKQNNGAIGITGEINYLKLVRDRCRGKVTRNSRSEESLPCRHNLSLVSNVT